VTNKTRTVIKNLFCSMLYPLFLIYVCLLSAADQTGTGAPTPAEMSIRRANEAILKHPGQSAGYNSLAMALARRARETSDVSYYARAEEALEKSFAATPNNFEGLKVRTWLLLGRHEFAKALDIATRLNNQVPDDISVYGYLADANAELGNYADAENAAQWMLNLRPGNIAGLTRGAYLRELYGNLSGAIELMRMAYDATSFQEAEDRAWILTQIAHIYLLSGNLKSAETYANGALGLFPNYHYTLGALASVRLTEKRYTEAADLLRKRYERAPHAENLYSLAEAQVLAGRQEEARASFAKFEQKALSESSLADNANHELIAYYIDHAGKPVDALKLASIEIARRHDVYTLDSYAWALAANGNYRAADAEMRKALGVGVKDPKILNHAEVIAKHLTETSALSGTGEHAATPEAAQTAGRFDGSSPRLQVLTH
jgi:tetratricopeptide (TPR) repeat protein